MTTGDQICYVCGGWITHCMRHVPFLAEEHLTLTGDQNAMGKIENRENVKAGRNVKGQPTVESTRTRTRTPRKPRKTRRT